MDENVKGAAKAGAAELRKMADEVKMTLRVSEADIADVLAEEAELLQQGAGLAGYELAMGAAVRVVKNAAINRADQAVKKTEIDVIVGGIRGSLAVLAALG